SFLSLNHHVASERKVHSSTAGPLGACCEQVENDRFLSGAHRPKYRCAVIRKRPVCRGLPQRGERWMGGRGRGERERERGIVCSDPCLTDVLEELAENSEFNESKGPCLAFRRAASVLKSLPSAVHCLGAIQSLPCLGEHSKAVMEEILIFGRSFKVEEVQSDERYQALKLFTSVFGVGPKTAEKWYRRGLRSLKEILAEPNIQLNRMQRAGFLYYRDISKAVCKAEAKALRSIIEETAHWIAPESILALTGGFRRGKEYGHDVDFLLTMPEMGKEEGLLLCVIERLRDQGILLYCEHQGSTFDMSKLPSRRFEAMDHFEKCFLILRLEEGQVEGDGGLQKDPGESRGWRAVRVDLVAPPVDRYAFALLGWTGSRQFERDLRRFAKKERGMCLDNHALYDKTKVLCVPSDRVQLIIQGANICFRPVLCQQW
uniref:DNA-directed DNA polymerase X domain-containing protein n=1 Tax=Hucho hucho TaxID=62062 RepID=A0A4W5M5B0_9TELE